MLAATRPPAPRPTVAEFFAGVGLFRLGLESSGFRVVWANDIEPSKRSLYVANFGDADFRLGDVRRVRGEEVPPVDVATASFPCVDLSLAGKRRGLAGEQSGLFWEFARVVSEMAEPPGVICMENVPAFLSAGGGGDMAAAIKRLNDLGYACDVLALDARRFVPQSRPRLFIVGVRDDESARRWLPDELRPAAVEKFVREHPELDIRSRATRPPLATATSLEDIVEAVPPTSPTWWDLSRQARFVASLSPLQLERLERLRFTEGVTWRTAYRRTRGGQPTWEIRRDAISGCLRTARGGSSKQALVECGEAIVRLRWMTPREYARLQGVPEGYSLAAVSPNQALFGLGDAVCVPAVTWLARECLLPLVRARGAEITASVG